MNDYLIKLCRLHLCGEKAVLDEGADYERLYRLAHAHNLSGIVFCVINEAQNRDVVPKEAFKRFENDFLEAVIRYDFQSKLIAEIDVLCEKESIRHAFFKGAVLRDLYPVPEARAMGDIDVLIDEENRENLKALLTSNGFECRAANGNVYEYFRDGLLVEAHSRIISGKIGGIDLETSFFNALQHTEFCNTQGVLEVNFHFAYLIAHIAHHFWFYGAGVKLILDLAVMLRTCEIDIDKVLDMLSGCGLDYFAKVILTVTHKWFGVGQPFDVPTDNTEEFLLSYGAFGNSGRNKAAVIVRKNMEENGTGSAFSTRLRLLFPSYDKVKNIPYISFIDGRPYLLPAAWAYRIYYNLKNRREFVRSATTALGSDETKMEAQRELAFFEEIGLL